MTDELKPCPFCNSAMYAEDATFFRDRTGGDLWIVSCPRCEYALPSRVKREDAIAAWNTRPAEDALRARIAELEQQIKKRAHSLTACTLYTHTQRTMATPQKPRLL